MGFVWSINFDLLVSFGVWYNDDILLQYRFLFFWREGVYVDDGSLKEKERGYYIFSSSSYRSPIPLSQFLTPEKLTMILAPISSVHRQFRFPFQILKVPKNIE